MEEKNKSVDDRLREKLKDYKEEKKSYKTVFKGDFDKKEEEAMFGQLEKFFNRDPVISFITTYIMEIYLIILLGSLLFKSRYDSWSYHLRFMVRYMGAINLSTIVILLVKKKYSQAILVEMVYLVNSFYGLISASFWYNRSLVIVLLNGLAIFIVYRMIRLSLEISQ